MRRLKWWALTKLHRPFIHRTGDKPCWLCALAWRDLERLQDFTDSLRRGTADLAAGRGTPWRDVR